ncbi:MAG TPA: S-layer homology domain-containing protein [Chloroflexia bacterium]|nr:S-layer homology domain-containing protein [Chloroflexia bacterium]
MTYKTRLRGFGKLGALALAALALLPAALAPSGTAQGADLAQADRGANSPAGDSVTLTGPGAITIPESDDYATQVQADPWDMNNIEDLDYPRNFTQPSLGGGIWSATTTGSNTDQEMFVKLVEQNFATTFSYIGERDGRNYPVSTQRFTRIMFRMYTDQAGPITLWWFKSPGDTAPCNNFDCRLKQAIDAQSGWHIYEATLNGDPADWANLGTVAGIRMDAPREKYNNNVKFDWIRLVPDTSTPVQVTFRASGGGTVNFYLGLTSDYNAREIKIGSTSATANNWTWNRTGVAPGTYYIHAELNGSWSTTGPITVNAAPVLQLIAPGPLSGEDFAQARLGQTWDGSNPNQFQLYQNLTGAPSFNGEYMQATSQPAPGSTVQDPALYWLYPYNGQNRGTIDTARYHYMTVKLWLQAPAERPGSPGNLGPRFLWSQGGDWVQTEGMYAPYNRWIPMSVDLASVPKAPGSPAYGWSGPVNIFRFDPHEEDDTRQPAVNLPFFRIMSAHLMSQPIANNATLVRWGKVQGTGSVNLYYDTNNSGFDGTLFASNVPIDQGLAGWNTSGLPNGTDYWVYAEASDGTNTSRYYSLLPVRIDHGSASTIFVDVPTNNPFANDIANLAARNIINGYGQPDGTMHFRPGATATRAQLSKMVVLGAGGTLVNPGTPSFMDVPTSSPLYTFVETAAARGIISGYTCGTRPSEPCDGSGRNYFRPNRDVTRGQISKMLSQAIGPFTGTSAPLNK